MSKLKMCVYAIAVLAVAATAVRADDLAVIQKSLISEYPLTQATADDTDIVTAGAVLVLKRSDLVMASASGVNLYQNTYKDGKITQNAFGKLARWGNRFPGSNGTNGTRTYVAGEKMWVTRIEVREDNLVFDLLTDPVGDVRYKAALKFQFPRDATAAQVDQLVSEVFGVQQDQPEQQPAQPAPASTPTTPVPPIAPPPPAAPAQTALPDIPPPPPPADQPAPAPTTIGLGQTPDQVIAALGQPQHIFKLTKKEIFYYHNLKVTFVGGKVTDVE